MEELENIRRCKICGKPMLEGYFCNDQFYCSDECLHKDWTIDDINEMMYQLKEGERLSDLSDAEKDYRFYTQDVCYYTEWDDIYFD